MLILVLVQLRIGCGKAKRRENKRHGPEKEFPLVVHGAYLRFNVFSAGGDVHNLVLFGGSGAGPTFSSGTGRAYEKWERRSLAHPCQTSNSIQASRPPLPALPTIPGNDSQAPSLVPSYN